MNWQVSELLLFPQEEWLPLVLKEPPVVRKDGSVVNPCLENLRSRQRQMQKYDSSISAVWGSQCHHRHVQFLLQLKYVTSNKQAPQPDVQCLVCTIPSWETLLTPQELRASWSFQTLQQRGEKEHNQEPPFVFINDAGTLFVAGPSMFLYLGHSHLSLFHSIQFHNYSLHH